MSTSTSTVNMEESKLTVYRNKLIVLGIKEGLPRTATIDWDIILLEEDIKNLETSLKKLTTMSVSNKTDIEGLYFLKNFLKRKGYNPAVVKFARKIDKKFELRDYALSMNIIIR